jgi:hypothetical protein
VSPTVANVGTLPAEQQAMRERGQRAAMTTRRPGSVRSAGRCGLGLILPAACDTRGSHGASASAMLGAGPGRDDNSSGIVPSDFMAGRAISMARG